jgi:general secretion pathway protein D
MNFVLGGTIMRLFCVAAFFAFAVVGSAATIRIDPATSTASIGGIVDVSVQVIDVTDLYAYQFDVTFDPAVVSGASVTEGSFLPGGGSTFFFPGVVDNISGMITLTAGSLEGPVPGVSGSGTLATLRFAGVGLGASPVTLSSIVLLDSVSGDITAGVENGSVTVVPETGSGLLIVVGIGVAVVVRYRRLGRF